MSEECCERCKDARPTGPCDCRCGGKYHGINRIEEEYPKEYFRTLNENLGGEIGETINKLFGKEFKCWCRHKFTVHHFIGYIHDGGLADKEGTKWWMFIVCPHCRYEWSWHKLERRLDQQREDEEKYKQILLA